MLESNQTGGRLVLKSRLKELVTEKEREWGRRIYQKEIATVTGLSENTITRWMSPEELEAFSGNTVASICDFFNCQPGDLL